jgi:Asp-tRNA(Asn)/Glu-tRNA(Gln) amidotransferase A subunit family amidase
MADVTSSIAAIRKTYIREDADPLLVLNAALERANSNASHNVYLAHDQEWSHNEARRLRREDIDTQPLWGIPISLKDCFDLAGFPTSCGSRFYRDHHGLAATDSTVAATLRSAGAVITGKTHLHQLAYGITGENRDFGDCLQPLDATHLTGGSSSGAAASVQEGSAMAAIGTDTGGSIRVPAALCGVAGYRSSITLNSAHLWQGGYHLAATFDTVGWLYRHLADGPLLGHALLGLPIANPPSVDGLRIGIPNSSLMQDCDPDVLTGLELWQSRFQELQGSVASFDASLWLDAMSIYAPIVASEASALHIGYFHHFEPAIAERLAWGTSLSSAELLRRRQELADFRAATEELFRRYDYLLLPCAPMSSIAADADHTETRARILRYTTPISLAGLPVVTLPTLRSGIPAGGFQLVGPLGSDAELLALSAFLSAKFEDSITPPPPLFTKADSSIG